MHHGSCALERIVADEPLMNLDSSGSVQNFEVWSALRSWVALACHLYCCPNIDPDWKVPTSTCYDD